MNSKKILEDLCEDLDEVLFNLCLDEDLIYKINISLLLVYK